MERGAQQDAFAPLHCIGLSKKNISSYRRRPEISPSFMLPLRVLCYLEGSWPSYRKRTRGRSFNDRKGFKKPGGRGRGQGRSTPFATSTKPGQSKEGHKTLTVSVSSDSKKRNVESRDDAPQPPGKPSVIFAGTSIKVTNNEGVLPPQMTPAILWRGGNV